MFTASITVDVNKTNQELLQPDHSGYWLTFADVRTSYLAAPFDGGLVF